MSEWIQFDKNDKSTWPQGEMTDLTKYYAFGVYTTTEPDNGADIRSENVILLCPFNVGYNKMFSPFFDECWKIHCARFEATHWKENSGLVESLPPEGFSLGVIE